MSLKGLTVRSNRTQLSGAVNSAGGTLCVYNCSFSYNTSDNEGAAIRVTIPAKGQPSGSTYIKDSLFKSNISTSYGGAITIKAPRNAVGDYSSKVCITGCNISNSTSCIGGGLYVNSVEVTVDNTLFVGNVARTLLVM